MFSHSQAVGTPASGLADFWLGRNSRAPQDFFFSLTAWQLTSGPEPQFACGPRVPWKERLRRGFDGTPPGFSFLLLFFPFFVRALILSPLSRVMGNVYVFSRIKVQSGSSPAVQGFPGKGSSAGSEWGLLLASRFFFSFSFSYVLLF